MKNVFLKMIAAATLFASASAFAVPVSGTIDFGGRADAEFNAAGDAVKSLTFGNVYTGAGDYTGEYVVAATTRNKQNKLIKSVNFSDITSFSPLEIANDAPLWSVFGFKFNLTSITVNEVDGQFIKIAGNGIISGNGFDETAGAWSLSTQNAKDGANFKFSSSAVPAPATIALLGLALVGFGAARRKKQA